MGSSINVRLAGITGSIGSRRPHDLVGPYLKADKGVRSEGLGDGNVRSIAPLGDQDTADPRNVVACIECVPAAAEIRLEPAGEVARGIRWWHADITEIARAIPGRDVHAAAERNGQMRVVSANSSSLVEGIPRRHRRARVLVAKADVIVHEVADRLHPRPTRRGFPKQLPRGVGKPVSFAITAAEKIDDRVRWQILDCMLN